MAKIHSDQFGAGTAGKGDLTLWELTDPASAVEAALELYGSDATTAAAWCALTAHFDGRESDYRFWGVVFKELVAAGKTERSGCATRRVHIGRSTPDDR